MEFALSQDQVSLQAAVRDLIEAHAGLDVARSVADDPAGPGDPSGLWERMAAQGWPAVLVPEEFEGLGLSLLDAAVIARRLGAGVVPSAFVPSVVGGEAIRLAGTAEQAKAWLPRLAGGEVRLAVALPEDGAAGVGVSAEGGVLRGEVPIVEWAHVAERIVVAAGDGSLWLADPAAAGVTVTPVQLLDGTTRASRVTFDGAAAEALPGGSADATAALVQRATALAANELAGIAAEALRRTVEYVKTREQFGRVVGSFQALKHHLAELEVGVTMAGHAGWYAAHAIDAGLPDAALAVSVAKIKASDVAREATAKMIQYHGGIGYTWEHEAHFFFKRAKRLEFAYGDATFHRELVAAAVV